MIYFRLEINKYRKYLISVNGFWQLIIFNRFLYFLLLCSLFYRLGLIASGAVDHRRCRSWLNKSTCSSWLWYLSFCLISAAVQQTRNIRLNNAAVSTSSIFILALWAESASLLGFKSFWWKCIGFRLLIVIGWPAEQIFGDVWCRNSLLSFGFGKGTTKHATSSTTVLLSWCSEGIWSRFWFVIFWVFFVLSLCLVLAKGTTAVSSKQCLLWLWLLLFLGITTSLFLLWLLASKETTYIWFLNWLTKSIWSHLRLCFFCLVLLLVLILF